MNNGGASGSWHRLEERPFLLAAGRNTLAIALADIDENEEADALFEQVLATYEREFGLDHPNVGLFLRNMGVSALNRGLYERARDLFERSLTVQEKQGPDSVGVAIVASSLGHALMDLGRVKEAGLI